MSGAQSECQACCHHLLCRLHHGAQGEIIQVHSCTIKRLICITPSISSLPFLQDDWNKHSVEVVEKEGGKASGSAIYSASKGMRKAFSAGLYLKLLQLIIDVHQNSSFGTCCLEIC